MSDPTRYNPPKVWRWEKENGGKFSKINRPISGYTHEKKLPVGKHDLQLYSQGTPNGVKITILLEELLELGIQEAEYDAWLIEIGKGDQFSSGFVKVNPNSKIPALVDYSYKKPINVFESGSILKYIAEKFKHFIPEDFVHRTNCFNWLFWQMGSAPYLGGGFGHYYAYAPNKNEYSIDRFTMETKRQLDLLDKIFSKNKYICKDQYSIADIAIWSWYGQLVLGRLYKAAEFLDVKNYKNVSRWARLINQRPAVKKGSIINKTSSKQNSYLKERHSKDDFKNIKNI